MNLHRPKVALLIESSRAFGRGLLRGIAAYARNHGPWSFYHDERSLADAAPPWLKEWKGDGILARIDSLELVRQLEECNLPVVDLLGRYDLPDVAAIEADDRATIEMCVEHLRQRGFSQFAFCGFAGMKWSNRRSRFLEEILAQQGMEPHLFEGEGPHPETATSIIESRGGQQQEEIARWIASLPRPIGLIACNDIRAQQVLEVCREYAVPVPDEVAVIGVDNDEVLCEMCDPPLSSIEPNTEQIGYQAAAVLERLMQGKSAANDHPFVPPRGVVTRQSTDITVISDREVGLAMRFIREHACEGISVDDVLRSGSISRSTLERRFARLLGRSPKAEIIRVQLERVKLLLAETDYILPRVASLAGFRHAEYMSVLFKQKVGRTPGQYRATAQKERPAARRLNLTTRP